VSADLFADVNEALFFKRLVGPSPAADCGDLTKQFAHAKRKRTRDHRDRGSVVLQRSEVK
jgi:hypothetical protein